MTQCRRFLVSGSVQGVFYRVSTQATARRLELSGWVRNRHNGSVELVACGAEEKLQELERWLWQGPPHARVERVQAADTAMEPFTDFSIV